MLLLRVIALPVVAEPSMVKCEPGTVSIAKVRPLTVPVRSSVPPEAVIEPAVEMLRLTVPEPLMFVFAAIDPRPLNVPPASVIPKASVKVALLSTASVPPETVCAALIVAFCAISSV